MEMGFKALEIPPVIYLSLHFAFIRVYILGYVISVILKKTGCFWDICIMSLWLWPSLTIWGGTTSLAIDAKWLYSLSLGMALQVNGVLPILPLLFPVLWILATAFGEARVLAQMSKASPTSLLAKFSEDTLSSYTEVVSSQEMLRCIWSHFLQVLKGKSPTLTFTSSLLHSLGSVTVSLIARRVAKRSIEFPALCLTG
uniref:Uncharacterized protein n=1 Tax=Micrurus paraensis TaxID=1970185 RepID=A0A2D4L5I3_9SAUR